MYDLENESKCYLNEVEPFVIQLRHLAFCFDTFLVSHEIAKEYSGSVNQLSAMAKSAFSKAIIVDYSTPFMTNEFENGKSIQVSTKYLTKSPAFNKDIHESLLELRHKLVAHAGYENPGLSVTATEVVNDRKNSNTHDSVIIPAQFFLQNTSMLFLDSHEIIEKVTNHIEICKSLTMKKANELIDIMIEKIIKYAPVANSGDFVEILNQTGRNEVSAKGESESLNIKPKSIDLKIGKTNIQFVITRVRMDRPYKGDYVGNGYRITSVVNEDDPSKLNFNVAFNTIQ